MWIVVPVSHENVVKTKKEQNAQDTFNRIPANSETAFTMKVNHPHYVWGTEDALFMQPGVFQGSFTFYLVSHHPRTQP